MTTKTSEEEVLACLSDIPQSQSDMSKQLGIHRSNITGWLRKLEVKGLAKKTSNGHWIRAGTQQTQQHDNRKFSDVVKYYLVHENIFPERPTTKLLEDSIAEIDDIVAKSKDIDISSKINKFYDLVNDIYYNRSGADYSRGLLRDGYINFGLQVPTYVPSKLDVNKYDDVSEC